MNLVSRYAPYGAYPYIEPNVRFSRIRLPAKRIVPLCLVNTNVYSRLCQWVYFQHIVKRIPCVTNFLTTSIEPIKQATSYSVMKAVYGSEIVSYAVIVIISNKYLIQLSYYQLKRPMPNGTNQTMDFLTFLCKLLLTCFPLDPVIS